MDWLAALIAAFIGLLGIVWKMLNDKIDRNRSECEERDKRLWEQIGSDSDSGMRKMFHDVPNLRAQNIAMHHRLEHLEKRMDSR